MGSFVSHLHHENSIKYTANYKWGENIRRNLGVITEMAPRDVGITIQKHSNEWKCITWINDPLSEVEVTDFYLRDGVNFYSIPQDDCWDLVESAKVGSLIFGFRINDRIVEVHLKSVAYFDPFQ